MNSNTDISSKNIKHDEALSRSERMSNFEALRIICLLFIIAGHMIMWHKFNSDNVERVVRCGIRPFFSVAVNCFVLISGWFGIKFKIKKIISLNNSLTFWTFLLCGIAIAVSVHEIDLRKDILMLVPLLTRKYWFITVYVALCFISPYLNILAGTLSRDKFKKMLVTCVCLFVLLPTLAAIFNFESITMDGGYGIVNFVVLYMFGRYMRLYDTPRRPGLLYFAVYIVLMAVCGLTQILFSRILGFEFTTFISYDTFFVFFGAVALFCAFSRLNFHNRYINLAATACFAVYIIHIHPWTGSWVFESILGLEDVSDGLFLLDLLIVPVLTYLCCLVMEQARVLISRGTKTLLFKQLK